MPVSDPATHSRHSPPENPSSRPVVLQSSTGGPRNTKLGGEGYEDIPVNFSPDLISLARRSVTSPSNVCSLSYANGLDAVDIVISNRICTAAAQSTGVLRAGDPSSHRAPRQYLGCARLPCLTVTDESSSSHLISVSWRH